MQQNRMLEGCVGAALFLAGGILVYGLADWIEGMGMTEYRAMVSVAGGPYEPAGDWTDDKAQAIEDNDCALSQWGSVRADCYIDERDEDGFY